MSTDSSASNRGRSPLAGLRSFARSGASRAGERCELCSVELAADHQHLVEPASRRLLCACDACAILFSSRGLTRYVRVPRRIRSLPEFRLSDELWESLRIPIGLAFFFHSSPAGKVVAIYPSPAGPTESTLDLEPWTRIASDNPILADLEADTEALLVNRLGHEGVCYLVPIDECYKLVGLVRTEWKGLSGGTDLRKELDRFFLSLENRATPVISPVGNAGPQPGDSGGSEHE